MIYPKASWSIRGTGSQDDNVSRTSVITIPLLFCTFALSEWHGNPASEREREEEREREDEILSGINRGKIARAIVEFRNEIGRRGYEDTPRSMGVRVADNDARGRHASRMFALTELCRSPRQPEISVRAPATIMFSVSRVPGLTAAKIATPFPPSTAGRVTRWFSYFTANPPWLMSLAAELAGPTRIIPNHRLRFRMDFTMDEEDRAADEREVTEIFLLFFFLYRSSVCTNFIHSS